MKKIKLTSIVIAVVMIISMIYPAAAVSPRAGLCPNCGSTYVSKVTVAPAHTNEILGGCAHGTHYYASHGYQWRCVSCKTVCDSSIVTGHYCTGNGGHYCWDGSCNCND